MSKLQCKFFGLPKNERWFKAGGIGLKKQVTEKQLEDIQERIEFTVSEMDKMQKRIDDLDDILENQKKLKLRHDILECELNQLRHTALP